MVLRKVTLYVLDISDPVSDENMKIHLTDCRYFSTIIGKVEHADIGPWHDDHELNKRGADYEKFFKAKE